ncbi:no similarity (plasmid) [Sinorhizobium fredii HH103]|nr:no similarity [Sinorhizobium fredii HH103]
MRRPRLQRTDRRPYIDRAQAMEGIAKQLKCHSSFEAIRLSIETVYDLTKTISL